MASNSFVPSVHRFAAVTAPSFVHSWIAAHPGQMALLVVDGLKTLTPGALTVPLLASVGIGAQGPIAGSVASWLQSGIGHVGADSLFAQMRSAAMAGCGAPIVNGIGQSCAVVHGIVTVVHATVAAWLGWK